LNKKNDDQLLSSDLGERRGERCRRASRERGSECSPTRRTGVKGKEGRERGGGRNRFSGSEKRMKARSKVSRSKVGNQSGAHLDYWDKKRPLPPPISTEKKGEGSLARKRRE